MPLPGFLLNLFNNAGEGIVKTISDTVDKFTLTKEEKEQMKQELIVETNKHVQAMQALAIQETEAYLKDADSARNMQIEALKQSDAFSKHFVYYLAGALICLTFVFDLLFFFVEYPDKNHDIINMIAGVLNTVGFASVVSFFFGSSASSAQKQRQIDTLIQK